MEDRFAAVVSTLIREFDTFYVSGVVFPRPLLLSVAVSPRPLGQVGHFVRSLLYLIELASASIDCIPSGLTIRLPGKERPK
jgi:hypothetical protein